VRLFLPLTIAGALLISACYNQPVISPHRPLRCDPAQEKGQCPKGFTCSSIGVCAPQSCQKNEDCPAGLACTSRGCVPPPDAGVDGAIQIPNQLDGAIPPLETDGGPATTDLSQFDISISSPDGGEG
jgi:hypothetical protein